LRIDWPLSYILRGVMSIAYSLLALQVEDRAVEANKSVTLLQKDVDRIEGQSFVETTTLQFI